MTLLGDLTTSLEGKPLSDAFLRGKSVGLGAAGVEVPVENLFSDYDFSLAEVEDGQEITSLVDASGNGRDLAPVSLGPILKADSLNGFATGDFLGNRSLAVSLASPLTQPWTQFMVATMDGGVYSWQTGDTVRFYYTSGQYRVYAGNLISHTLGRPIPWTIWTWRYNLGGSLLRKNGVQVASGDVGNLEMSSPFVLGNQPNSGSQGHNGEIAKFTTYNGTMPLAEMQEVEGILSEAYGIPLG